MITLTKGNTEIIYYTASEKALLGTSAFKIVFINSTTNAEVSGVFTNTSTTARYDKSSINVNTYFSGQGEGFWTYEIFAIDGNGNYTQSVEKGYMNLFPATPFAPTEYSNQSDDFNTYKQ